MIKGKSSILMSALNLGNSFLITHRKHAINANNMYTLMLQIPFVKIKF